MRASKQVFGYNNNHLKTKMNANHKLKKQIWQKVKHLQYVNLQEPKTVYLHSLNTSMSLILRSSLSLTHVQYNEHDFMFCNDQNEAYDSNETFWYETPSSAAYTSGDIYSQL